ncbi:uncharacterized protein HD556DRAFT_1348488 [Suillus plorans]|uniref:DUF6533 domain-containing protein n=1 Tax=Suillus plorans TaxID=116603 RepID=A0A9P7J1Y1_9AGAM|nr:uncharacterized protein HD556DRAFT_1348488 [Suillus plorans]KAG1798849.1 hypothetical protein HD556DRAFT_1348488 [Suillus plorans]
MYTITDLEAQQVSVYLYILFASISVLIYDHVATLPEEIMFIWRRPKAMSAVLFLINRYLAVLNNILALMGSFLPVSPERLSCSKYVMVVDVLQFFQQIFICLTLTLRTYALYGCSRRLLKWMLIIGVVLLAGALAGTFGDDSNAAVYAGDCHEIYTPATSVRQCTLSHIWMYIDGATELSNRRSWDGMGGNVYLRTAHLCPHSLQGLEN